MSQRASFWLLLSAGVIVIVLALAAVTFWWARGAGRVAEGSPAALDMHRPTLTLRVNGSDAAVVIAGTPLTFDLVLANDAAIADADARLAAAAVSEDVDELLRSNKLSAEEARRLTPSARPPSPAEVVTLAPGSFGFSGEGGRKLPWTPQLVSISSPAVVTLDADHQGGAVFAVPPDASVAPAGTYRVWASFDATSTDPSQWKGRLTSNEVHVTVKAALSSEERQECGLTSAEYFLARRDYASADRQIASLLAEQPDLIDALVLQGRSREGRGDLARALESYRSALDEFRRQHPKSDEPPFALLKEIQRIHARLDEHR